MSRNGSVLTIYLLQTKNSGSFKDLMVMQCLGSQIVNSNLIKMSGYNPVFCVYQEIIRFEHGKNFRLTEARKNIRLDPNLDPQLTILQS